MAKGKKKAQPPWLPALEGLGVSLGTYLLGQLLVTLLRLYCKPDRLRSQDGSGTDKGQRRHVI